MNVIELNPPYLIFLGDVTTMTYAKTGAGLAQWRPGLCAGQLCLVPGGVDLGLPAMTVAEAKAQGVRSLVVGTASVGGESSPPGKARWWRPPRPDSTLSPACTCALPVTYAWPRRRRHRAHAW